VKEVWCETFPNESGNVKTKLQKRKEIAKMQKEYEMSAEEIEKIEQEIPEWKRGAVVLSD
jgi:uncharacterized protein YgfB (UPF0149 family)